MSVNPLDDLNRSLRLVRSLLWQLRNAPERAIGTFAGTSVRARILRGTSWSLVGSVTAGLLQLFLGIVLARQLGLEGYGQFSVAFATSSTAFTTLGMVVGLLTTRQVAESRSVAPIEAGRASVLAVGVGWGGGLFFALFLWLGSGPLSRALVGSDQLSGFLALSSLQVAPSVVALTQQGILAGLERFREIAVLKAVSWLLIVLACSILASKFGVGGALAGLLIASLATASIGWYLVRRSCHSEEIPFRFARGAFGVSDRVWRDSIPAVLSNVIGMPALWFTNALLTSVPGGLGEIAVVNAAMNWRNALLLLPSVVSQSLLPVLSSMYRKPNGQQEARTVVWRAAGGVGATSLVVALGIAAASSKIMSAYGPAFAAESQTLVLLMISAVAASIASVLGTVLFVVGKLWESLWLNVATNLVLLAFVGGLRAHGAEGFALSYAVTYSLHAVVAALYVHRLLLANVRLQP